MTRSRGFTLVELIMVMVIIGIVSAAVSVFIAGPVSGYVDANRRAQLSDSADTALRRMARDLRLALPNSMRVGGGNQYLEFIPTTTGSRYRTQGSNRLDFTTADSSFDYLGASISGATGFVVIFNTAQCSVSTCDGTPFCLGANAYEGCNRTAIGSVSASAVTLSSTFRFPFESPGNRFHVVPASGPVTYACETVGTNANGDGTGTLRIYTGYNTGTGNWSSTAPAAAPGGTPSLLAQYVSGCNFIYTSGVTASNGLVTLRLTLTRRNETITLHHQVHVDNVP